MNQYEDEGWLTFQTRLGECEARILETEPLADPIYIDGAPVDQVCTPMEYQELQDLAIQTWRGQQWITYKTPIGICDALAEVSQRQVRPRSIDGADVSEVCTEPQTELLCMLGYEWAFVMTEEERRAVGLPD